MRKIDKLKKKLVRMNWLNKNKNNILLWIMLPCAVVHFFLTPFFPIVGIVALSIYGIVGFIGGMDIICNEEKHAAAIDALKQDIDALQGADQETIVELARQIEEAQDAPILSKRDKIKKKRLIKELIKRRQIVEEEVKKEDDEINLEL